MTWRGTGRGRYCVESINSRGGSNGGGLSLSLGGNNGGGDGCCCCRCCWCCCCCLSSGNTQPLSVLLPSLELVLAPSVSWKPKQNHITINVQLFWLQFLQHTNQNTATSSQTTQHILNYGMRSLTCDEHKRCQKYIVQQIYRKLSSHSLYCVHKTTTEEPWTCKSFCKALEQTICFGMSHIRYDIFPDHLQQTYGEFRALLTWSSSCMHVKGLFQPIRVLKHLDHV